jgi:ATP-dependent phosphofructokinase / diphosphate-dependent phosphofructokinase
MARHHELMKRIGILTGGGDVPGLNPAIKAAVWRATEAGHEMIGIRRGWGGLLHYDPDDPDSAKEYLLPLDRINTRTIDRTGGTILHTSRTNPARVSPERVPDFLRKLAWTLRPTS